MARIIFKSLRELIHYAKLSPAARREYRIDATGLPQADPGIDRAIETGLAWLCLAQDCSSSKDGGVAGWYSLLNGWSNSYPETTGYLVPTMLECARLRNDPKVRPRVARMLDWLVSIQRADGSYLGGLVGSPSLAPVAFDTGQILLGLTSGVAEFGTKYLDPLCRAADWLVAVQDADGCWRRYPPPHTVPGDRVFDTHIARGLLEAARLTSNDAYAQTAIKNVY
jgi:hypothetical protein